MDDDNYTLGGMINGGDDEPCLPCGAADETKDGDAPSWKTGGGQASPTQIAMVVLVIVLLLVAIWYVVQQKKGDSDASSGATDGASSSWTSWLPWTKKDEKEGNFIKNYSHGA